MVLQEYLPRERAKAFRLPPRQPFLWERIMRVTREDHEAMVKWARRGIGGLRLSSWHILRLGQELKFEVMSC